ncbi:hypothetical protein niasHS_004409 [Heterodera schachtii]|uniref:Uncharacterized protein n=1 Tax=Heterodera schachtii TaxID=97005 RepID=A0ABD2JKY9_HETSC
MSLPTLSLPKMKLSGKSVAFACKFWRIPTRVMAEALLAISAVEEQLEALKPVEQLRLEELKVARKDWKEVRRRVLEAGTSVDDVNDWASNLQATGIHLSDRVHPFPCSEHFLVDLVEPLGKAPFPP